MSRLTFPCQHVDGARPLQNYCCRISHVVSAGIEMQNSCESLSWKLEAVLCFINKTGSSDPVRGARRGVEGAQLYDRLLYPQLSTTIYSETLSLKIYRMYRYTMSYKTGSAGPPQAENFEVF